MMGMFGMKSYLDPSEGEGSVDVGHHRLFQDGPFAQWNTFAFAGFLLLKPDDQCKDSYEKGPDPENQI